MKINFLQFLIIIVIVMIVLNKNFRVSTIIKYVLEYLRKI